MRIMKSKSTLKRKLQIEHSNRSQFPPENVIIDGCALMWIHWPASGTVADYIRNVMQYVMRCMAQSDVYLVFDRYYEQSIKGETRATRAAKSASRRHRLNASTPLPPQKVTLS